MAKTTLIVDIEYDPELTDPEGLASAMDRLMEMALSTPGIMEEYGDPRVGEFFVTKADGSHPKPGSDKDVEIQRRWVLYNPDTDVLLTTRVYASYEDAADDASQINDVLVLPLVYQGMIVQPAIQPAPHDPQEPGRDPP